MHVHVMCMCMPCAWHACLIALSHVNDVRSVSTQVLIMEAKAAHSALQYACSIEVSSQEMHALIPGSCIRC